MDIIAEMCISHQAEQNLGEFKWSDFGQQLNSAILPISHAKDSFLKYTTQYSEVLKSIDAKPNWVYEAPNIAQLPSLSFYSQSRIVESASVEDLDGLQIESTDKEINEQNDDILYRLLPMLDPGLVKMWEGAVEALHGSNPDFIRHFLTSLRELYTHVMHLLSPDKNFVVWDTDKRYFANDRPTREGRLHYINRNLHGSKKEFTKFLGLDVTSTIELINLFQGGTHGINSKLTKPQLMAIKIKAGGILRAMLEIEFSINRVN